jgi:hypothetical protein
MNSVLEQATKSVHLNTFSTPDVELGALDSSLVPTGLREPLLLHGLLGVRPDLWEGSMYEIRIGDDSTNPPVISTTIEFQNEVETIRWLDVQFRIELTADMLIMTSTSHTPLHVSIHVSLEGGPSYIQFKQLIHLPLNARTLFGLLQIRRLLSSPFSVRIEQLKSKRPLPGLDGTQVFPGQLTAIDNNLYALAQDLAAIEEKIQRPLLVPARLFTAPEAQTLGKLRTIIRRGRLIGDWAATTLDVPVVTAREMLQSDSVRRDRLALMFVREETESLFGTEITMGKVRYKFYAKLLEAKQIHERLESEIDEESPITLAFRTEENVVFIEYDDWLPSSERPGIQPYSYSLEEKEELFNKEILVIHQEAHREEASHMVTVLQENLSSDLVAYIAGRSLRVPGRGSQAKSFRIDPKSVEDKVRTAFEILMLISRFDSSSAAKYWFLGMNSHLGGLIPADAIRRGRLKEAIVAARAFVAGG